MTWLSWRNATFALAAVCAAQRYRACTHHAPAVASVAPAAPTVVPRGALPMVTSLVAPAVAAALPVAAPAPPRTFHGLPIPGALARVLPQPGETLRAYRDRVLPLAEAAIAPQRARVARIRDELALSTEQRATLDATVTATATAIENRILAGIARGELDPHAPTPMGGVVVARDVLDEVARGDATFRASLTEHQRASLGALHFDFADYLAFSAPWEDALRILD